MGSDAASTAPLPRSAGSAWTGPPSSQAPAPLARSASAVPGGAAGNAGAIIAAGSPLVSRLLWQSHLEWQVCRGEPAVSVVLSILLVRVDTGHSINCITAHYCWL